MMIYLREDGLLWECGINNINLTIWLAGDKESSIRIPTHTVDGWICKSGQMPFIHIILYNNQ